jgi:predicted hydrocarbon binding protein
MIERLTDEPKRDDDEPANAIVPLGEDNRIELRLLIVLARMVKTVPRIGRRLCYFSAGIFHERRGN